MKTWRVKTTKDIDTVQADDLQYTQVCAKFVKKEEQKAGAIIMSDGPKEIDVISYPYQNVISIEEITDGEV